VGSSSLVVGKQGSNELQHGQVLFLLAFGMPKPGMTGHLRFLPQRSNSTSYRGPSIQRMKHLHLFLLSSSIALACAGTRVSAVVAVTPPSVVWGCDTSTCFSLTITGIGSECGGDFKSPSGDWQFADIFKVVKFHSSLELQQTGGFVECMPPTCTQALRWYSGFGRKDNGSYEANCTLGGAGTALDGWNVESFISYEVLKPNKPNTWEWTVVCHGSGPDLLKHCLDQDGGCPAVPEPSTLWLVGVGASGLTLARWRRMCRRTRS